jgi:hypothetical protein
MTPHGTELAVSKAFLLDGPLPWQWLPVPQAAAGVDVAVGKAVPAVRLREAIVAIGSGAKPSWCVDRLGNPVGDGRSTIRPGVRASGDAGRHRFSRPRQQPADVLSDRRPGRRSFETSSTAPRR